MPKFVTLTEIQNTIEEDELIRHFNTAYIKQCYFSDTLKCTVLIFDEYNDDVDSQNDEKAYWIKESCEEILAQLEK